MISILYHIITKTATLLYQNCGFYLAEQERFELYSFAVQVRFASLGLCPYACRWQATAGASFASVLVSKLPDTPSLAYLRRIHFVGRAQRGKSLMLQKAEKDSHESDCLFLAEQERFELSRRYSRPTPLAGAPLHHLSTTPRQ